jgi:putative addiction module CopG family antidote
MFGFESAAHNGWQIDQVRQRMESKNFGGMGSNLEPVTKIASCPTRNRLPAVAGRHAAGANGKCSHPMQNHVHLSEVLMNISVNKQMQAFVENEVKSGRYATPADVVNAGLTKLMQGQGLENLSTSELEAIYPDLRKKIAEGLEDFRTGKFTDGEEFFEAWERRERSSSTKNRKTA